MRRTEVSIDELARRLSNWDRWGHGDQRGTLNYLSDESRLRGIRAASSGRTFSLAVPFQRLGPVTTSPRRFNPLHFMTVLPSENLRQGEVGMSDDVIVMPLQCSTQWDALSHVSHRGALYGGRTTSVVSAAGAAELDVCNLTSDFATRGVLLDVARTEGLSTLSPGRAIEAEDLEACLSTHDIAVGEGDVILVRTGFLDACRHDNWNGFGGDAPGLGLSVLEWAHDRRIAAIAADTYAVEVKPYASEECASPFHVIALVYMGMPLGEIFDLGALASDCAQDGRYDFLFVAGGLPVVGAVGTPVNPYAIK